MPRNAEVIRQWHILRAIEASRRATIDGLAQACDVSTRTIRRDLEALQEAGFPLYDEKVDGKTYWKLDTLPFKKLADAGLTLAELCALYFSRTIVECLAGTPFQTDLARAFDKLQQALPPRMRQFLDRLPGVLAAKREPARKRDAAEHETIARLLEATLAQRRASMRYHSMSSDRTKDYLVEPYRVVYAQGGLYLFAYVPAYREVRTFAVERIRTLSLLDETFEPVHDIAGEAFSHSLGTHTGPPEHVEIAFEPRIVRYIEARLWHPTQRLQRGADGSLVMTLDVCNDWALRSWILGFGPLARVLAPDSLAEQILTELTDAQRRYGTALRPGSGQVNLGAGGRQ